MGKKLERTPILTTPLFVERLSGEVLSDINRAITTRKVPFIDDITAAENVSNFGVYRIGAQIRGMKNNQEKGVERALKAGSVSRAVTYRLLGLTLVHAVNAAENLESIQETLHGIRRDEQIDPYHLARTADAGVDLAHGLQRQHFFSTSLRENLPGVVLGLSEQLRDGVSEEDLPFISVLGNDAQSKKKFWTQSYRHVVSETGLYIKPEHITEIIAEPRRAERLLHVRILHLQDS